MKTYEVVASVQNFKIRLVGPKPSSGTPPVSSALKALIEASERLRTRRAKTLSPKTL